MPVIACGVMMLLICIPMIRNMHKGHGSEGSDARREIGELHQEIARLKAERVPEGKSEALDG